MGNWYDGDQDRVLITHLLVDIPISVEWKHDFTWTGNIETIIDCFDVEVSWFNNGTTNIVSIRELQFLNPEDFINAETFWREDTAFKKKCAGLRAKKKAVQTRKKWECFTGINKYIDELARSFWNFVWTFNNVNTKTYQETH